MRTFPRQSYGVLRRRVLKQGNRQSEKQAKRLYLARMRADRNQPVSGAWYCSNPDCHGGCGDDASGNAWCCSTALPAPAWSCQDSRVHTPRERRSVPTREPTWLDAAKTCNIASNLDVARGQCRMLGTTPYVEQPLIDPPNI